MTAKSGLAAFWAIRSLWDICEKAANLFAVMIERSFMLQRMIGRMGFIVPVSSVTEDGLIDKLTS